VLTLYILQNQGHGLLHVAACDGNIEAISSVFSIPGHDWIGTTTSTVILTPLMIAVQKRNVAATKKLLERGANFNEANVRGWSCMHSIALQDDLVLVLEQGATTNSADMSGDSPCLNAPSQNVKLTTQTTEAIGANATGVTPLRVHAQNGYMDVVKVILERSSVVEIEMLDALGQKPDSMAVRAGNFHRSSEGKDSRTCVRLKYSTYHEGPCRCLHLRVSI
jgi:ankyrin repeat protein